MIDKYDQPTAYEILIAIRRERDERDSLFTVDHARVVASGNRQTRCFHETQQRVPRQSASRTPASGTAIFSSSQRIAKRCPLPREFLVGATINQLRRSTPESALKPILRKSDKPSL